MIAERFSVMVSPVEMSTIPRVGRGTVKVCPPKGAPQMRHCECSGEFAWP